MCVEGGHELVHALLAPFRLLYLVSPTMVTLISASGLWLLAAVSTVISIEHHLAAVLGACVLFSLMLPLMLPLMLAKIGISVWNTSKVGAKADANRVLVH